MQHRPILSVGFFLVNDYVLGSFHQDEKRFGKTAGMQCAWMVLTASCWSVMEGIDKVSIWRVASIRFRKVSIWRVSDLGYTLESGDRVYKNLGRFGLLSDDDLPSEISVTDEWSKWSSADKKLHRKNNKLPMTVLKSYSVLKSAQGSYNQGHGRFGATAGMQCTCISLFSLCWSVNLKVSIWQSHDLDYILCTGDKIYKDLGVSNYLNADDLPVKIYLNGQVISCSFS